MRSLSARWLRATALHGLLALLCMLAAPLWAITLDQGSLHLDVRADNGAIDTITFNGADFFNPGSPISNFGFQLGADTASFRLNDTSGGTGVPATTSLSGGNIVATGTYTAGGANVTFTRTYSLVPGQNAVRVATRLTNNAASTVTVRYFDSFDPDQRAASGDYNTAMDVLAVSGINVGQAYSSDNLTFLLGPTSAGAAVVSSGSPYFSISDGSTLNNVFTTPADANGASQDQGTHIVYERAIAAGGSVTMETLLCFGTSPANAQAAFTASLALPGTLDLTFNSTGKATLNFSSSDESAHAVAVQPDGKTLVAGWSFQAGKDQFALARYNRNGTLDTTFGGSGKVVTLVGSGGDHAFWVAVQNDGKILLAGEASNGSNYDFALLRYLPDGTLDPSFGTGGKVTTAIGSGNDTGFAGAVQSDGKIVVGGYTSNGSNLDVAVVRYTSTGALDTSFGTGGKVTTPVGSGDDYANALALQSDGKIVVGGTTHGSTDDFLLVCYTSAGALDTTFGTGGKVTTAFFSSSDNVTGLAVQSDGKIVAGGTSYNGSYAVFALARYNTDGTLDTGFGTSGKTTTLFSRAGGGGGNANCYGIALQPDGKIVATGNFSNDTNYDVALARYTTAGVLDTSFGTGGKVTTTIGTGDDFGSALAISPLDGSIAVTGYYVNGAVNNFFLARYVGTVTTTTNQSAVVNTGTLDIAPLASTTEVYNNNGFNIATTAYSLIGDLGYGTLNQTGGTHTSPDVRVGFGIGSSGTYNLSSGTVSAGEMYLGYHTSSTGVMNQTGGNVTTTGYLNLARNGTAIYDMSGGTMTPFKLAVGSSATGTFTLHGGTVSAGHDVIVGAVSGGNGTMNHSSGSASAPFVYVGRDVGATGTYTLSGTGAVSASSLSTVGLDGTGTFTQTGGTHNAPTLNIGTDAGSNGTYNLSGGTLTTTTSSDVGISGTGSFTQTGGTNNIVVCNIGRETGSSGTYSMSAGTVAVSNFLRIGRAGTGTFLHTGGTITAPALTIGGIAGGIGNYTLNGGTTTVTTLQSGTGSASIAFISGTITATNTSLDLGAGGFVVGNGTSAATLVLGNGTHTISNGVHVKAASQVLLSGAQAGTVAVSAEGGTVTNLAGATQIGALTASSGSVVDPSGPGFATTFRTGNVQFAAGVTFKSDLVPGTGGDQLSVTGTVALGGATLNLSLLAAPTAVQALTIVDNDGADAVSGTFAGRAEGATFNLTNTGAGGGTYPCAITYKGGSGNDVVVYVNVSAPTVATGGASGITNSGATLAGTVNANGSDTTTLVFDYGTTAAYGSSAGASPAPVTGASNTAVGATLSGLLPHKLYHYRARATNGVGTTNGSDATFTTANTNPTAPNGSTTGTTGDAKTITLSFPATDADGDTVSITNAASGTGLTINAFTATSVTFTPAANFVGNTSFTYTVSDGFGGTATGTIAVTVTDNDAPVITPHNDITVTATRPDGARVSYEDVEVNDNCGASITLSPVSGTVFPIGTTTVTITATDAANNTATATFDVTVKNVPDGPGKLDRLWGAQGIVDLTEGFLAGGIRNVAVQSDEKVVVVGRAFEGGFYYPAVERFTAGGGSDDTFGFGGVAIGDDRGGYHSVVVQSDGKIVAVGGDGNHFILSRLNEDGSPDTSFNTTGKVSVTLPGYDGISGYDLALQNDGKIVAVGQGWNGSGEDALIVRVNGDGSLDTSFNGTGIKVLSLSEGAVYGVAMQSDGRIVAAGYTSDGGLVTRLNADGSLDTTFGSGGTVITSSYLSGIAVQPDGKIVVTGSTGAMVTVRLTPDGTLDPSFNGVGVVTTAIGGGASGNTVAIQANGKIVVAGDADVYGDLLALVRYNADGSLDTTFHEDGIALIDIGNDDSITPTYPGVALREHGQIVSAAYTSVVQLEGDYYQAPPIVVTLPPTDSGAGTVTLHGTVNPKGASTTGNFEYGRTTAYDTATEATYFGTGTATLTHDATLTGLAAGVWHYRFAASNPGGASFGADMTFTIADTTAPVVTPPANSVAEATSAAGAAVTYSPATATDDVGVTSLTYSKASGSVFALGVTTVTATATDAAGNSGSATFTVTVQDTIAPVFTVTPSSQSAYADGTGQAAVPDVVALATATDAVGVTSLTQSPTAGTLLGVGSYTITLTAQDAAGHSTTANVAFTVVSGNTPPVAAPDVVFGSRTSILVDVLGNDSDADGQALSIAAVTQPAAGGVARIEAGKVRFTPDAAVSAPISFTYTVSDGLDSATGTVTVKPLANLADTYYGLVRVAGGADASARGRVLLTVSAAGGFTGSVWREGGVIYPFATAQWTAAPLKGAFASHEARVAVVPPKTFPSFAITFRAASEDGAGQPVISVAMPGVSEPLLAGNLERAPFSVASPTSAAGRYTFIAEQTDEATAPALAAASTCTVAANGTATLLGRLGTGRLVSQAVPLLSGGRLIFYQGAGYGAAVERLGGEMVIDRNTSPEMGGTLHWKVAPGVSLRPKGVVSFGTAVDRDYAVTGLNYTPAATTAAVFNPSGNPARLSLTPVTLPLAFNVGLLGGNTIAFPGGKLTFNLANGSFSGTYMIAKNVSRSFVGVVLQGGGINRGRGFLIKPGESSPVLIRP